MSAAAEVEEPPRTRGRKADKVGLDDMGKVELLAPAGNAAAALAAFDAGADAVYAGLARFNARERSENFTVDGMARMVEYAHGIGRRVYVTVNTVVKEAELAEVAECLAALADVGPDAVIVQDLGVVRMVRRCFPRLALHGSTQMGIHNSAGLKFAAELGLRRVILERQVTFDELRVMRGLVPDMELEIFVHGALCCSLSGQCLLSSWHGGASGNRGKCKQPCRRRYFGGNGNGFFFSTQDLCMIDSLDEIFALGVSSLKIEGRLRQPDYVSNTVAAYRMMMDAASGDERRRLLGEARGRLARTCGRRWSHGFYREESPGGLISHGSVGAAGLLCGRVDSVRGRRGFSFVTSRRLHVGDRLRLQPTSGDDGAAFTVTKMFVDDAGRMKARPGESVFICCDKEIDPNSLVFKIGEETGDYSVRVSNLPPPKKTLNLEIECTDSWLQVSVVNAPVDRWTRRWSLEPADNAALKTAVLERIFREADSDLFRAGDVRCSVSGRWFCPMAELKRVRREFWSHVKSVLRPEMVFSESAEGLEKFRRQYLLLASKPPPDPCAETVAVTPGGERPRGESAVLAVSVFHADGAATEAILPEFCPENELGALREAIRAAYGRGIRRFRAPAMFGLELLKPYPDATVTAGGVLPVCNSMTAAELADHGVVKVLGHVELEKDALLDLAAHSPLPVEQYRFGRPALLVTRARIPIDGAFRDARGHEYFAVHDGRSGLTRIYSGLAVSAPDLPGTLGFRDLTNARAGERRTSTFNFNVVLQ